jgi:hypothetical protein
MKISSLLQGTLLMAFTAMAACNHHQPGAETKPGPVATKSTGNNLISFKVNGEEVRTSGWTISRFSLSSDPSKQWLNITSNMHDEKRVINVNLSGATPGDYVFDGEGRSDTHSHGSYFPDYMENLANSYSFKTGSFHITGVDTVKRIINGTFSGSVKNLKGEVLQITDGKIENGTLNTGVIVY